jgi:hypothetical protein
VFGGLLPHRFPPTRAVAATPWWRQVPGASWRRPEGGDSDIDGRGTTPWSTCRGWTRVPTADGRAAAQRGRVGVRRARWA